jgi:shikimate dehydrogenase
MSKFGLIGYPLKHSFSKAYFSSKFEREGLADFLYENYEMSSLNGIKELIAHENLAGFNVTIPFKEKIIPFLDELSGEAIAIGSVNTVVRQTSGKLIGHNTDYLAFMETIKPLLKPCHTQALIIGNGGSSKTVAYVLNLLGIQFQIVTRTPLEAHHISYENLLAIDIRNAPLIINTTPLGMFPNIDEKPDLPYAGIDKFHLLYDLIYNPTLTAFLQEGQHYGAATKNGYDMLLKQAEESWKLWSIK